MSSKANWTVPAHVPAHLVVDFDYMNPPGVADDVHLAWKVLHQYPDVIWSPYHGGHWIASRANEIEQIQKDSSRFSYEKVTIPADHSVRLVPLELDPPEHTPYRALITPSFLPQAIGAMEPDIRQLAIELIEGFASNGECEFIEDFAQKLPIVIFLRLVNLPLEDRVELLEMAEMSTRGTFEQRQQASQLLGAYLGKWVAERQANPGDDLLSLIVNATIDDNPMPPDRLFGMLANVMFGGLDTVASILGFICHFLATHPAERQRLLEEPALINTCIDELIRRHGVATTARIVLHDMELAGAPLKAGDAIQAPNMLASLDERRFDNPMQVNLDRKPVLHHNFGNGVHRCPGSFLARTEIKIFIQEWLKRIPNFELAPGEKPKFASGPVSGVLYLPLRWNTAP